MPERGKRSYRAKNQAERSSFTLVFLGVRTQALHVVQAQADLLCKEPVIRDEIKQILGDSLPFCLASLLTPQSDGGHGEDSRRVVRCGECKRLGLSLRCV